MGTSSLTVIIATRNAAETIGDCLNAISAEACEIIIADGSSDATLEIVSRRFPGVEILRSPPGTLVPELWARGIEHSGSPWVLLTTGEFQPGPDWIRRAGEIARENALPAVGGPIEGPRQGRGGDWAVFFTRYSGFMPPVSDGATGEIAGDNAMYRLAELDRFWVDRSNGFWEVLYHRQLRAHGLGLIMDSQLTTRFARVADALEFARSRFRHGQHYGSTRELGSSAERFLRIGMSPAIMPLMMFRVMARVLRRRRDLIPRFIQSLPWQSIFAASWSLGELRGLISRR